MDAVKRNERILHADHRRAVGQAPTLAFSNSLGTDPHGNVDSDQFAVNV